MGEKLTPKVSREGVLSRFSYGWIVKLGGVFLGVRSVGERLASASGFPPCSLAWKANLLGQFPYAEKDRGESLPLSAIFGARQGCLSLVPFVGPQKRRAS